jgi:hypothetical protein
VIDPHEALPSWQATSEQLLFVGHSHLPGIYVIGASGAPHFVDPCDFQLEDGKRYIVNPGSVGYPRAGDCRSSYCIYDADERSIAFRSIPFDCEGYRQAVLAAGLEDDPWLAEQSVRRGLPVLRERLSFARPSRPTSMRADVQTDSHAACQDIPAHVGAAPCTRTHPDSRRGRIRGLLAGRRAARPTPSVTVPPYEIPPLVAFPLLPPDKNLLPDVPASVRTDGILEGWRYAVEDRSRQQLTLACATAHSPCASFTPNPRLQLESPLINLDGTNLRALRLAGRAHRLEISTAPSSSIW